MPANRKYLPLGAVCLLVSSLVVAPAFAATTTSNLSSGSSKPTPIGKWRFQAELAGRWDDNITELSSSDRDQVGESGASDRFKIKTPDDWVWTPSVRAAYSREYFSDLSTELRFDAEASLYQRNSIKDYQTFRFRLAQELPTSRKHPTRLVFRFGYLPDYYLRELTVAQASLDQHRRVRDSVNFSDTSFSAAVEHVLIPRTLELTVRAGITQRDYGSPFDERDGDRTDLRAGVDWTPHGDRRMTLRAGLRFENYDASGDRSETPALEPDISNRRYALTAGATYRWKFRNAEPGRVEIDLLRQRRTFTAEQAADTFHFDRHDTHTEYSVSAWQEITDSLFVRAEFAHEVNASRLGPGAPDRGGDDDVTDYTHNTASVSIGWRY